MGITQIKEGYNQFKDGCQVHSNVKMMLNAFFDSRGVVFYE